MSLAFTSIKKNKDNQEKINRRKNNLHTLLGDINGLGDKDIFDDKLINSKHNAINASKKLQKNKRYPDYGRNDTEHYEGNGCNGCIAYSDMIKFYHKLLLIIIIGLLLKFILDTIVSKNIY